MSEPGFEQCIGKSGIKAEQCRGLVSSRGNPILAKIRKPFLIYSLESGVLRTIGRNSSVLGAESVRRSKKTQTALFVTRHSVCGERNNRYTRRGRIRFDTARGLPPNHHQKTDIPQDNIGICERRHVGAIWKLIADTSWHSLARNFYGR